MSPMLRLLGVGLPRIGLPGKSLTAFSAHNDGTIQIIMALALPVLLVLTLGAMELSNMLGARHQVQNALDAAVLAAVRADMPSDAERSRIASEFINENLPDSLANRADVTVTITTESEHSTVGKAEIKVDSALAKVLGGGQMKIEGFTRVKAKPHSNLELALVLDTTGSMSGSKLETLKASAHELTQTVMGTNGSKVAVVPFARYVNVGLGNRDLPGLSIPADIPAREECSWTKVKEKTNCRNAPSTCERKTCRKVKATCDRDGVPYDCEKNECRVTSTYSCMKQQCDWIETGAKAKTCKTSKAKEWKGCIGSREYPLNTRAAIDGKPAPGLLDTKCSSPLTRLTESQASVKAAIDALKAEDETYVAPGLLWGWRALQPDGVFGDGANTSTNDKVHKVLVLMTDGKNTISKKDKQAAHAGKSSPDADRITREVCENAKKEGIILYTVAFQIADSNAKKLVAECASDEDKTYFEAVNAEDLQTAFRTISQDLTDLYIAQ
jgi:Flp pilus assembly protein TadG